MVRISGRIESIVCQQWVSTKHKCGFVSVTMRTEINRGRKEGKKMKWNEKCIALSLAFYYLHILLVCRHTGSFWLAESTEDPCSKRMLTRFWQNVYMRTHFLIALRLTALTFSSALVRLRVRALATCTPIRSAIYFYFIIILSSTDRIRFCPSKRFFFAVCSLL